MFRRFGSKVTIMDHNPQLMAREDSDVADEVASVLREDGISLQLGIEVREVQRNSDGNINVIVGSPEGESVFGGADHDLHARLLPAPI